jgi:hypothetical protein
MTGPRRTGLAAVLAVTILAANESADIQQPVTWLIFVDDLHVDFRNTGRIRDLVRKMAKTLPAEGDLVAMYSSGPSGISVAPTSDRAVTDAESKRVIGNGLRAADMLGPASAREVRYRAAMARSRLLDLVATAEFGTRTAIIYVSNGSITGAPPPLPGNPPPQIFAIDPRLLESSSLDRLLTPEYWTTTRAALRAMAETSGGFVQEEHQSLDDALQRIIQTVRQ